MYRCKKTSGFTLIELMIVIVILAILVSVAYPAYQEQIQKSNREEGRSLLMQILQQQKRFKTENLIYTADLTDIGYLDPQPTEKGRYSISAATCAGFPLSSCVNLTATALGNQSKDGNLSLSSNNIKTGKW